MKNPLLLLAVAAGLLAAPLVRAANDAGASTFESGESLYRVKTVRLEDIPVPPVEELPPARRAEAEGEPLEPGVTFPIDELQVSGNTLLPLSRVDEVLAPFRGEKKRIADVQAARDALQKAYDDEGLLSVAVTIPQQTVDQGVVRLDVTEARVGRISVENEGVAWFSDESVREATQSIRPGAVLLRRDFDDDLARANQNPDRRVRPTLRRGAEPGTVDVVLRVDDRIPLHGSLSLTDDHTPGSPTYRMSAELRYTNLWGLGHEVGGIYQFPPFDRFHDVQVLAGTYRAPMPWDDDQSLFYYIAYSDTRNGVVTAPDLSVLGNGLNQGVRYRVELAPLARDERFTQAVTLGADLKDVRNTLTATGASVETPIRYLPFNAEYSAFALGEQAYLGAQLGLTLNRAGTVHGGSKQDFENNRGGDAPDNHVTGDFEIVSLGLQHAVRLAPVLKTLAAGRFIDLAQPTQGFADDWTLNVSGRGQWATEPLISTEQFAAGGMESVRGYLQSEQFGDDGWSAQFEIRSPALRTFLGGRFQESAQLVGFYDTASLHIQDAAEGQESWTFIQGYGLGLRTSLLNVVTAEFFMARPRISTQYTTSQENRYYLRIGAGF